jgi:hypothetical protein
MLQRSLGTWLAPGLGLFLALAVGSSFAESHVRIVRLSQIQGTVQVDRGTGQGFEKAFLNMPVVQDMKLATKDDGRAEVEFEDGSTLRLASGTNVVFSGLSAQDSGAKVTSWPTSTTPPNTKTTRLPWPSKRKRLSPAKPYASASICRTPMRPWPSSMEI